MKPKRQKQAEAVLRARASLARWETLSPGPDSRKKNISTTITNTIEKLRGVYDEWWEMVQ